MAWPASTDESRSALLDALLAAHASAGQSGPSQEGGTPQEPPAKRWRALFGTRRWRAVAVLGTVTLITAAAVVMQRDPAAKPLSAAGAKKTAQIVVAEALQKAAAAPAHSADVYRAIAPSLVTIVSDGGRATDSKSGGQGTSLGAGVIINADGAILTAFHVIDGAESISLTFADGTKANGSVQTADPDNDIAVLVADTNPEIIVPAVLGGGTQIGDEVYAVGNPLGLIGSMSSGVVSGLNRSIPIDDTRSLDGLIQFDAAANPGNSGGPLLNRDGQVVGIVSALANPADQPFFTGIAFAVTIETAGGAAGGPQQ